MIIVHEIEYTWVGKDNFENFMKYLKKMRKPSYALTMREKKEFRQDTYTHLQISSLFLALIKKRSFILRVICKKSFFWKIYRSLCCQFDLPLFMVKKEVFEWIIVEFWSR